MLVSTLRRRWDKVVKMFIISFIYLIIIIINYLLFIIYYLNFYPLASAINSKNPRGIEYYPQKLHFVLIKYIKYYL